MEKIENKTIDEGGCQMGVRIKKNDGNQKKEKKKRQRGNTERKREE